MSLEHRLFLAVAGARRRIREGIAPEAAAIATARMMDVRVGQVLRLAVTAELGCEHARMALAEDRPRGRPPGSRSTEPPEGGGGSLSLNQEPSKNAAPEDSYAPSPDLNRISEEKAG